MEQGRQGCRVLRPLFLLLLISFLALRCKVHLPLFPYMKFDKFRSQNRVLSPSLIVMHQLYDLPRFLKHPSSSLATGLGDVRDVLES